ncbi:hypothetical protein ACHAXT_003597 [Thalassiosira profunda]
MATPFSLSEEDLRPAALDSDAAAEKIPILRRRAANDGAKNDPTCVIVVGMAGSGKTTLMAQLQRSLNLKARDGAHSDDGGSVGEEEDDEDDDEKKPPAAESTSSRAGYAINLDPAAKYVPFQSSIDIRDTVDYLEVMRQHKLGPNGAILTCLNLFATKFDQVMDILERRAFGADGGDEESGDAKERDGVGEPTKSEEGAEMNGNENDTTTTNAQSTEAALDYILVDTPGQIEAFTWSASGSIVTSALATAFPTVLAFVVDTPRCAASVHTFMSNMLYACSMLYRAKLPMVVVLNKTDVVGADFVKEWMEDYDSFQEALDEASSSGNGHSDEMAGGSGYYSSLTRSLSLVLDELYNHLHKVGVSAATGDGVDEFWEVVQRAAAEYEDGYLVDLKNRIEEQKAKERAMQRAGARRLARDLQEDGKL